MSKVNQRRIDLLFKRKRDEVEEGEPIQANADHPLPLLELEQHATHNQDENQSNEALQKKSQDIVNAVRLVSSTKECLEQLRSDDGYEEFFFVVDEFCIKHSIEIPDFDEIYIMRGGRARHQPDQLTKEHYFRVEIFRATLDTQLFEINRRFNEKVMDLLSTSATLIPRNKFRGFKASDICEMVKKYYPADFSQQDIYGLQLQLKHFVLDASKDEELKNISTLISLCQCLVETGRHAVFNLVERLL